MNLLQKISDKFSKKSVSYDEYVDIQKITADELITQINQQLKQNSKILDIGSGTGYFADKLNKKHSLMQLDIAFDMCQKSEVFAPAINADMQSLPIKNDYFDCVISSFALHWADNLNEVFNEVYRTLKQGGLFIFSIPIEGSLKEVNEVLENQNLYNIINEFPKENEVLNYLQSFLVINKNQKNEVLKYDDLIDFLRGVKSIGASQKFNDTSKLTKYTLKMASELYLQKYSDNNGKIKIFWNNLFIIARKI